MTLTNFPNGISSFGMPQLGSSLAGNQLVLPPALFVDTVNGVNAGAGTSPTSPYQTLAYAVSQAVANSFIFVLPGSAITVSSSTGLAIATAGLQIIAQGNRNARPTITLDTANTATIAVSVANVSFQNFIVVANFLSIAAAFTLSTAKGFTLIGNEFRDTSGVLNFLNIVKSTGAANTVDQLTCLGNTWNGLGTTSLGSFVLTANDINGLNLTSNTAILSGTNDIASLITVSAGVLTNAVIAWNSTYRACTATTTGALINVGGTTSTGIVKYNTCMTLDASTPIVCTPTVGFGFFENYISGALILSGLLNPVNA